MHPHSFSSVVCYDEILSTETSEGVPRFSNQPAKVFLANFPHASRFTALRPMHTYSFVNREGPRPSAQHSASGKTRPSRCE
jgi:hypothetical protein